MTRDRPVGYGSDPLDWIAETTIEEREQLVRDMATAEHREWRWYWPIWARRSQLPPEGDWRVWLVMAGRGFGKTRAGAEWVRAVAEADPEARIALVAASLHEARSVMVEGDSGVMAVSPPHRRPRYEPSLRRLIWPNGAQATLFSAGEPEALRGPQHSHACRAVAEGNNGQRGPDRSRYFASPCNRSGNQHAALHPGSRTDMACRLRTGRRVHWQGDAPRRMDRRRLALRCAS